MDNTQPQQPPQPQSAPQQTVPPADSPTPTPPSPSGKKPMPKIVIVLIIFLIFICVAAAGAIAYNLFLKPNQTEPNDKKAAMEENLEKPTPSPVDQDGTPSPTASPSAVQSQIEEVLNSKNYAALESNMAESVNFTLYASECCGPLTAEESVAQLSYLDTAAAPWDFDQTSPVVESIKTQNAQEYGSLYIGISSNNVMAAFGFDETNKISIVKVAVTYKLLVAE